MPPIQRNLGDFESQLYRPSIPGQHGQQTVSILSKLSLTFFLYFFLFLFFFHSLFFFSLFLLRKLFAETFTMIKHGFMLAAHCSSLTNMHTLVLILTTPFISQEITINKPKRSDNQLKVNNLNSAMLKDIPM